MESAAWRTAQAPVELLHHPARQRHRGIPLVVREARERLRKLGDARLAREMENAREGVSTAHRQRCRLTESLVHKKSNGEHTRKQPAEATRAFPWAFFPCCAAGMAVERDTGSGAAPPCAARDSRRPTTALACGGGSQGDSPKAWC